MYPTRPRIPSVLWATGCRWKVSLSSSLMKMLRERSSEFQACRSCCSCGAGGMSRSRSSRAGLKKSGPLSSLLRGLKDGSPRTSTDLMLPEIFWPMAWLVGKGKGGGEREGVARHRGWASGVRRYLIKAPRRQPEAPKLTSVFGSGQSASLGENTTTHHVIKTVISERT